MLRGDCETSPEVCGSFRMDKSLPLVPTAISLLVNVFPEPIRYAVPDNYSKAGCSRDGGRRSARRLHLGAA